MAAMSERVDAGTPSDELVRRVLAGDTESFAMVVRRYQGDVWKVAVAMLGDPVATENLVQQTFVNAYQRLTQYQLGRDLGLWLKGIARNLVREEMRRRSRENDLLSHYRAYVDTCLDDEHIDDRENTVERVMAACRGELAPAASRALTMYYDEGRNMEEVSEALGRTVTAVRLLVFRARLALRRCIEAKASLA